MRAGLRLVSRHDTLARFLPAALLTCGLALYNHFPLTYPDTGNYLDNAHFLAHGREPWFFFRPLTYGLFLVPFASAYTIWFIPLAQGFLVAWVVDLTLRSAMVSLSTRAFLALFAGLSAFTALPWVSGQIMPDIFTSVVVLLSFVALWGDERLTRRDRWLSTVLLTFAIATHLSHLLLYGLLLAAGLAGRWLADGPSRSWRQLWMLTLRGSVPLAVAAGLVVLPNYWLHREPVLSRSGALFALARLVASGAAQRYLDRACPTQRYLLCFERPSLRADVDWFLWAPDGPRGRHEADLARGDSTFLREAATIVAGTIRQEWPTVLRDALRSGWVQLRTFGIHHGSADHTLSATVAAAMKRIGPAVLRGYKASREAHDALPVEAASLIQYIVVGLGLLVLLGCLPALRGPTHRPLRALIATVCVGLVLNAQVMAALAAVRPRYQSRVAWLLPLVAAVAAGRVVGNRRSDGRLSRRSAEAEST